MIKSAIIVGQGLAGTLLSWFLQKEKVKVYVVDQGLEESASHIAAGIINPITGRRVALSWNIDRLLPFARSTYRDLEDFLGDEFMQELPVDALFDQPEVLEQWEVRREQEEYRDWVTEIGVSGPPHKSFRAELGYARCAPAMQVNLPKLLLAWRKHLSTQHLLSEESFDYSKLMEDRNGWSYRSQHADVVFFAEGIGARHNPWFSELPVRPNRGQRLLIKATGLNRDAVRRKGGLCCPMPEGHFWLGSTHEWHAEESGTTPEGLDILKEKAAGMLNTDWTVLDHSAGIRPTSKDRRPFVGKHPGYPGLAILNGLGTKGTSLGPYYANILVRHLIYGEDIPDPVRLDRFVS